MKKQDRRSFLKKAGIVGVGATLMPSCSSTVESKEANLSEDFSDLYNLDSYKDNIEALVKVMGDLDGKPVVLAAEGRIYAVRDKELSIPLCRVMGTRYTKFEKTENGYRQHVRDWAFYLDLKTGEPIDEYTNPLTGETVKTKQILTNYMNWEWTPNGQVMKGFNGNAWQKDRPLIFPFTRNGNDMSIFYELLVQYESGVAGGEVIMLMFDANDLNNPELKSIPMRFAWTGNSSFMRWLNMGDIKGRTLWQSTGKKYSSLDDMSDTFKAAAEKYFPGSLAAPETYEKVSFTTMPGTEDRKTINDKRDTTKLK